MYMRIRVTKAYGIFFSHVFCTYQLILISRDGREHSFWEHERPVLFRVQVGHHAPPFDQMYPRLISVHRVQDDLCGQEQKRNV